MSNQNTTPPTKHTGRNFPGFVRAIEHAVTRLHNFLYRLSNGKLGGTFFKAPVILLSTTGRKSGKTRTVPLLYLIDGDSYALVASHGGDVRSPAWCHNLRANPEAQVELNGRVRKMRAEFASDSERDRLWPKLVQMYKPYESYQKATSRKIPVILLRPTEG